MKFSRGITLIGLLLGIAIGAILLGGLMLFATRGFNIPREQTEQVRIVEDARIQIERLSDAIRDARSIDTNGDELATLPEELWLQAGDDFAIDFLVNVDSDPEIERVRYFIDGTKLKIGVRDPYTALLSQEKVTVLAKSVRNQKENAPLFQYLSAEGETAFHTPVIVTDAVKRVRITLLVDVNEDQDPPAATVSTIVTPRASSFVPASPAPTPIPPPLALDLKANGQDGPITVNEDEQAQLTWTSASTTSCTASGGWSGDKPVNGSEDSAPLTNDTTFTLTCNGPAGQVSDSVSVTVVPLPPTVDIKANGSDGPVAVATDSNANLSWESLKANSCVASVDWSGNKPVNGTESVGPLGNRFALVLDGTNEYVEVDGSPGSLPNRDFTYSLWVRLDQNNDEVLLQGTNALGADQLVFYVNGQNKLEVRLKTTTVFTTNQTLPTGVWTHVVVRRAGGSVQAYLNGALAGSGSYSSTTSINFVQCPLHVGVSIRCDQSGPLYSPMAGRVDELRVYSRAISDGEIGQLATGARDVTTGLFIHLLFDEGVGTTAVSSNGNGWAGALKNMEGADWDGANKAPLRPTYRYALECTGRGGMAADSVVVTTLAAPPPPPGGGSGPPPTPTPTPTPTPPPLLDYPALEMDSTEAEFMLAAKVDNTLWRRLYPGSGGWETQGVAPAGAGYVRAIGYDGVPQEGYSGSTNMVVAMSNGRLFRRPYNTLDPWQDIGAAPSGSEGLRALTLEVTLIRKCALVGLENGRIFRRCPYENAQASWQDWGTAPSGEGKLLGLAFDNHGVYYLVAGMESGKIFQRDPDNLNGAWAQVYTAPANHGVITALAFEGSDPDRARDYPSLVIGMADNAVFRADWPYGTWQSQGTGP